MAEPNNDPLKSARAALLRGDTRSALSATARILRHSPRDPGALHLQGMALVASDRARDAVKPLRKASKAAPHIAALHRDLARALYLSGETAKSCEMFRQVLKANSRDTEAMRVLGTQLSELGQHDEALSLLQRALQLQPEDASLRTAFGSALMRAGRYSEAEAVLTAAVELSPDDIDANLQLGTLFCLTSRYSAALAPLTQVLVADKEHWTAWFQVGKALQELNERPAAEDAFRQVIQLNPKHVDAHMRLGALLAIKGVRGGAEGCYRTAIRLAPKEFLPRVKLGYCLMREGRLVEAERAFQWVRKRDPTHADAVAGMAMARERRRDSAGALQLLRPLVSRPTPSPLVAMAFATASRREKRAADAVDVLQRALQATLSSHDQMLLQHALGDVLDDIDRPDDAFAAFHRANELRKLPFDGPRHRKAVRQMIECFPPGAFERLPRSTLSGERSVLIVGMPRSGTTLVEQIVASHPAAAGGGELETWRELAIATPRWIGTRNIWYAALNQLTPAVLDRVGSGYLERLAEIDSVADRVTDKMPHNFMHLGLVAMALPGTRVIHCVRDPVDSGWSCYRQLFMAGLAWTTSLAGIGHWAAAYLELMAHWKQVLPLDIFEVRYADLVAEPEPTARALVDFAGLEWDDAVMGFHRSERLVATASYAQVQQPVYGSSVGRAQRYRKHLQPLVDALNDPLE